MEVFEAYKDAFVFLSRVMRYTLGMVNSDNASERDTYKSLLHKQLSVTSNNIFLKHLAKAFSIQLDSDTILFTDSVASLFDDICAELYGIELPEVDKGHIPLHPEQDIDTEIEEEIEKDGSNNVERVKSIISELSGNSQIEELARRIESRTKGCKAKKYMPASMIKCVITMERAGLSVNDISTVIANSSEIKEMLGFDNYPRKDIYHRIYIFARYHREEIDAILNGVELPKTRLACPYCDSDKVIKYGKRATTKGKHQIYQCKDCGKKFTLQKEQESKVEEVKDEEPEQESEPREQPTDANLKAIRNRVIELARQNRNMNSIKDAIKEEFGHELQWKSIVTWINANRALRKYHGTIKRLSKSMDAKGICKWLEKRHHTKIPVTIMDEYLRGVGEWGK